MMPLAHPGVCVLAQNLFIIRLGFFFLTRRRRCRCTTSASHVVRLSLCLPLFISSRLCCLSSDTDLLLSLYVRYPLTLLTHGAYVNRTMTYDHTTSSWRSTIFSLLASTTDIILFYFFFAFSSSCATYPIARTDAVFRQGEGWDCVRGRPGPVVRIHSGEVIK